MWGRANRKKVEESERESLGVRRHLVERAYSLAATAAALRSSHHFGCTVMNLIWEVLEIE